MLFAGVRAGTDAGDTLVHERGRVRHRTHDGNARRESRLDLGGGNRGGDREHRLLRCQEPADLAEQDVEVLRLDCDHDERGVGDSFRIGERRLDAVPVGHLLQPFLAPSGDDDIPRLAPAGTEQPGEERLADLAGAEDGNPSISRHATESKQAK